VRRRRRAVTLVELIIVVMLTGTVMLTVGYVTTQITSGVANVDRRSQAQTEAALAMVRIRNELEYATSIVALDSKRISFKHPDVNGDNQVDTITYEWSGVGGDPITREINEGGKQPVLDRCRSLTFRSARRPITLIAGRSYPLKLEYYDNTGLATCVLKWSARGVSKQVVPSACLRPASIDPQAPNGGAGLTGQYYDNIDFTDLRLTRTDAVVDFDWGYSRPALLIDDNTFSIRWTGQVCPAITGEYTFYVTSDDGVRLWVNGMLVIDNWTDHTSTEDQGASMGLWRIDIGIEAGSAAVPVRLDGAVNLVNRPGMEG
jgi:type II secretory pathway pseudopilin PulG